MKCKSRILTEYKTTKADSIIPMICPSGVWIPFPEDASWIGGKFSDKEICNGDVTVKLRVSVDGGCGCCGSVGLEIEDTCTRCKSPWYDGKDKLQSGIDSYGDLDITWLLDR